MGANWWIQLNSQKWKVMRVVATVAVETFLLHLKHKHGSSQTSLKLLNISCFIRKT